MYSVKILKASALPKNLSYQFNARYKHRQSKAYKAMRRQLVNDPKGFFAMNKGIIIVNGKLVTDGGTTYAAIMDAIADGVDVSEVEVSVRYHTDVARKDIAKQAAGLNTQTAPHLRGFLDIDGTWASLKKTIKAPFASNILYKTGENPDAIINVDFVVQLLHLVSKVGTRTQAYTQSRPLLNKFAKGTYEHVIPFTNDLLVLTCEIARDVCKYDFNITREGTSTLPDGTETVTKLQRGLVFPVVYAYGLKLVETGSLSQTLAIWKELRHISMRTLKEDVKKNRRNLNALGKDGEAYANQLAVILSAPPTRRGVA